MLESIPKSRWFKNHISPIYSEMKTLNCCASSRISLLNYHIQEHGERLALFWNCLPNVLIILLSVFFGPFVCSPSIARHDNSIFWKSNGWLQCKHTLGTLSTAVHDDPTRLSAESTLMAFSHANRLKIYFVRSLSNRRFINKVAQHVVTREKWRRHRGSSKFRIAKSLPMPITHARKSLHVALFIMVHFIQILFLYACRSSISIRRR